jgi:1,2-dihydroxy-3-keto-5-methylthiopentene dioxygenase
MARIRIQDENREITSVDEIRAFLAPHGIWYEKWDVEGRLGAEATNEEILSTYAPEIERLKAAGGFLTADVINVSPTTPGLDGMLAKFSKEHTHSEDEVRFTVKGSGVFHIHPQQGPVFAIQVESGDLINVPAGTKHWFDLCSDKTIRCIRLFQDMSGWTPHYVEGAVHERYTPLCLGPSYVSAAEGAVANSVVRV